MVQKIHQPEWRSPRSVGKIITRVQRHAAGEVEMTSTQIAAAKLYLSKTIPDLSSVDLKATVKGEIKMYHTPGEGEL